VERREKARKEGGVVTKGGIGGRFLRTWGKGCGSKKRPRLTGRGRNWGPNKKGESLTPEPKAQTVQKNPTPPYEKERSISGGRWRWKGGGKGP